jgi:hypothetical protein
MAGHVVFFVWGKSGLCCLSCLVVTQCAIKGRYLTGYSSSHRLKTFVLMKNQKVQFTFWSGKRQTHNVDCMSISLGYTYT